MVPLERLAGYTNWANRSWIEFAYGPAGEDGYLTRSASHIILAEQVWFQRVYGEEVDAEVFRTRTSDELQRLLELHQQRYAELVKSDLTRVIAYKRFSGEAMESTVGDILLHLVTHGAHHRGQMAAYASQKNMRPPYTDYVAFCRMQG